MKTADLTQNLNTECAKAAAAGLLHGAVLAAGTAHGLNVLWAWGFGSVAPSRRVMSAHARFDVASVTKTVATTSACAVCIDRGLIDPEAPVAHYLPDVGQIPGTVIHVRDLATHSSGYDNRKFDTCPPEEVVENAIRAPAQWPPRTRYEYSCRNFIVLGRLVETVTGMDLAAFCRENVFDPTGMEHTAFGPLIRNLEAVVPTSQDPGIISDEQARRADTPVGNAGLFSTATDLTRFCQMLLLEGKTAHGQVFHPTALKWLTRRCSPKNLPRRAFGWDMRPPDQCLHRPSQLSDAAIGHSGWTGQSVWIDPEKDLFSIVLTNRTHKPRKPDNYEPSMRFRARIADRLISQITP